MTSKQQTIIGRVQALLTKTVENGCTEAEAMSAAEAANRLMEEYDLSYDDLEKEVREEKFGARRRPFGGGTYRRRTFHEVWGCVGSIANYFDCRVWRNGSELIFFGSANDSELAHDYVDFLRIVMTGECAKYIKSPDRAPGHGRTLRASFMMGMSMRIDERLREMKRSRTQHADTSRALVVLKGQIVTEKYGAYLRENNIRMGSVSGARYANSSGAYASGKTAGSRIDLGVGKIGSGAKRIGGY